MFSSSQQQLEAISSMKIAKKMISFFSDMKVACENFLQSMDDINDINEQESNEKPQQQAIISKRVTKQNKLNQKIHSQSPSDIEQPQRKEKDPTLKRPPTAFQIYYAENYKKFSELHPGKRMDFIIMVANKEWKSLPQQQRDIYEQRHMEKKEIFHERLNSLGLSLKFPHKPLDQIQPIKQKQNRNKKQKENDDLRSIGSLSDSCMIDAN